MRRGHARDDRDPHTEFRQRTPQQPPWKRGPPFLLPAPMPSRTPSWGSSFSSYLLTVVSVGSHLPLSFQQGQAEQNTSSMRSVSSLGKTHFPVPEFFPSTVPSGRRPLRRPSAILIARVLPVPGAPGCTRRTDALLFGLLKGA